MRFFNQLGALVEQRWKDKDYSDEAFPEISARALAETDSLKDFTAWDVIRELGRDTELPMQRDDKFGDLLITLYQTHRFRIELYYWLDGTTSVHQHGFTGAFQVLLGSSIHSHYSFEDEVVVNPHFSTGRVGLKSVQLLEKGDIKEILAGRQYIHSLFHLDRPSVTLTVRTNQSPQSLPQYDYLKPYFAFNPFFEDLLTKKKVESTAMLLRMKHPEAYALIDELASTADFQTTCLILGAAFRHLLDKTREQRLEIKGGADSLDALPEERAQFNELFKNARRRHGARLNLLLPVLSELHREGTLVDLRKLMTRSDHRFFLALLLNVPHRTLIPDLVAQRFPQKDPVDTICEWVREFSAIKNPKSPERNILGVDDFDDFHVFVLRGLLAGRSADEIRSSVEAEYAPGEADTLKDRVDKISRSCQSSVLIKSMLSETPVAAHHEGLLHAAFTSAFNIPSTTATSAN